MKPFVFFEEPPVAETLSAEDIPYCEHLNLHILASTGQPAIDTVSFDTDTFTKAAVYTNEQDYQSNTFLSKYLDTQIQTRGVLDQTESDYSK